MRDEECHFRKRATTPLHVRNRVLAHGTLFSELVQWLDDHLRLPLVDVPERDAETLEEIERAAEACREYWDLKVDAPIQNMTRVLERAGVVVAAFSGISTKLDAFSWHGRRPMVIRSTDKGSTSRARWDLAHECGHLVLHAGVVTGEAEREGEANRFASAFLLPRRGFAREFPRSARLDWTALFRLKQRWGASLQAIVRRAYDLRLLSAVQYRRAHIHISKRGWRTREPQEPEGEALELVTTALSVAQEKLGKAPSSIARELGWRGAVFEAVAGVPMPEGEVIPLGAAR
ncbi:MAG: ImmA/IrrE family metallo-endopeptidase [Myxococcota bacterium]